MEGGVEAELELQAKFEQKKRKWIERRELRALNCPESVKSSRKEISSGKIKLKFDLKKSTAFAKKLKIFSESNYTAIVKDAKELNLTRYMSECVAALTEAPIKAGDIPLVLQLISILHQRYNDFTDELIESFASVFTRPKPSTPVEQKAFMLKRRVTLRLLAEMYIAGVFQDVSVIVSIIDQVVSRQNGGEGRRKVEKAPLDVTLLVSFAKAVGYEFFGVMSRKQKQMNRLDVSMEEEEEHVVDSETQTHLREQYGKAFDLITTMFLSEHEKLKKRMTRNENEELNRGEVSEQHVAELEASRRLFEKLQTSVTSLADALDKDVPELPEDAKCAEESSGGLALWGGPDGRQEFHEGGPFDDEDTRSFYEDLPDLLEIVPRVVLGLSEEQYLQLKNKATETEEDAEEHVQDQEEEETDQQDDEGEEEDSTSVETSSTPSTLTGDEIKPTFSQFDIYLEQFEQMVNRERCDSAAENFFYHNNKGTRRRLIEHLYRVPRTHLELLPYYSRFIAIIQPVLKEVAEGVVKSLMDEFRYIQRKRNQHRLESKLRNIRYLAELIKFKVAPPNFGFRCLKQCLDDFQGHNIDIGTTFLESCGRYLHRLPHTHDRMEKFLEIMMRLKSAKNLDPRAETLIQNAYFMCKPPERSERRVKQYDPLYLYLKKLLYVDLNEKNVKSIIETIRKCPWQHRKEDMVRFFRKVVFKCTKGKFNSMHLLSKVVAGLVKQYDHISVELLDELLERITFGLEIDDFRERQRQIGQVKLLAELFNSGVVSYAIIFQIMYLLLNHGHDIIQFYKDQQPLDDHYLKMYRLVPEMKYDPRVPCTFDSTTNATRIRLICTILETCGSYFNRGLQRVQLIRFFTFFQRYIHSKQDIPMEIEFAYLDLLESLNSSANTRGNNTITRYDTFDEAEIAVQMYLEKDLSIAEAKRPEITPQLIEEDHHHEEEEDDEMDEEDEVSSSGESEESSSDEDDVVLRGDGISSKRQEDDEEFENAFKTMLHDSVESRKHIGRFVGDINMAIPTVVKTTHEIQQEETEKGQEMVFRMLKRGHKGKVEAREFLLPKDTSFAAHSKRYEKAEKQQQSELKRLVLQNVARNNLL